MLRYHILNVSCKLNKKPRRSLSKVLLNRDGRLYFNKSAMEEYGLKKDVYVICAYNEDDINDKNIYLVIVSESEKGAIKVTKNEYLNTTFFCDQMGVDCVNTPAYYIIDKKREMGKEDLLKLVYPRLRKRIFENSDS